MGSTLPRFPKHHGCHEGDEGDEGHEGEEGVDHRQGEVRTVGCVPWQQGEDPRGLKKTDLMRSKTGKIVSKANANGNKAYAHIKGWTTAVQKARKALGVKGFQAVKKGSPLYKKAKELYGQ